MPDYGSGEYWENHYRATSGVQEEESYEWLQGLHGMRHILLPLLNRDSAVLNVGCGNSRLGEYLYDCGVHNVLNIDISSTVIDNMIDRNDSQHESRLDVLFQHQVMDMAALTCENETFDIVIDKSSLDALMCKKGDHCVMARKAVTEAYRVLRPGGAYVIVSYGKRHSRVPILQECLWCRIDQHRIPKPGFEHIAEAITKLTSEKRIARKCREDEARERLILERKETAAMGIDGVVISGGKEKADAGKDGDNQSAKDNGLATRNRAEEDKKTVEEIERSIEKITRGIDMDSMWHYVYVAFKFDLDDREKKDTFSSKVYANMSGAPPLMAANGTLVEDNEYKTCPFKATF